VTGDSTLRGAVIGAGHLGTFHCRVYSELPGVELRYVVDADLARAEKTAARYGGEPLADPERILGEVDVASIVTPTTTHHEIARSFIAAGVSVLVEKPITTTVEQADDLIALARSHGVKLQVGHIERFNPAFRAVRPQLETPLFIECHRLAPYTFRSTDVSVVLDLMIHDLDLILDITGGSVESIDAAGAAVLSRGTDIANARLTFRGDDGRPPCVANVTASRISFNPMRRLRVFQADSYVSMDFLAKQASVFHKNPDFDAAKSDPARLAKMAGQPGELALGQMIEAHKIDTEKTDALGDEIAAFLDAVRDDTPPPVTGEDGRRALALAIDIENAVSGFLRAHNS